MEPGTALLAAIAIPNYMAAKNTAMRNACTRNLRQIEQAKMAWPMANQKGTDDVPTPADLDMFLPRGFESLKCPAGGTYSINPVAEEPTCTIESHGVFNTESRRPAVRRMKSEHSIPGVRQCRHKEIRLC